MNEAITGILGLAAIAAGLAFVIYWIVCLTRWNGEDQCDEAECEHCPFPCDKHKD